MNRKQRRAQKSETSKSQSIDEIPLVRPPENTQRKGKTLYELAAERQAALTGNPKSFQDAVDSKNVVNVAVGPNGEIKTLDGSPLPGQVAKPEDMNPWVDTLLLAISLSFLHFTLEALTVHQYADELRWKHVFWHTALQAFPILFLLIHFMHGHLVSLKMSKRADDLVKGLRQFVYLVAANVTGCYLIYLTNDKGYMAVMKNAPSVGTVWVWSVIEMGLLGAVTGVAGPGLYAWYYGYGIV